MRDLEFVPQILLEVIVGSELLGERAEVVDGAPVALVVEIPIGVGASVRSGGTYVNRNYLTLEVVLGVVRPRVDGFGHLHKRTALVGLHDLHYIHGEALELDLLDLLRLLLLQVSPITAPRSSLLRHHFKIKTNTI